MHMELMAGQQAMREVEVLRKQLEIVHADLDIAHTKAEQLRDENRSLWSQLHTERQRANALQARVDHLTDEAKRWRAGQ